MREPWWGRSDEASLARTAKRSKPQLGWAYLVLSSVSMRSERLCLNCVPRVSAPIILRARFLQHEPPTMPVFSIGTEKGLIQSGLVWFGLVWSGLVWSGLFWSSLVWSGSKSQTCKALEITTGPTCQQ